MLKISISPLTWRFVGCFYVIKFESECRAQNLMENQIYGYLTWIRLFLKITWFTLEGESFWNVNENVNKITFITRKKNVIAFLF